MTQRDIEHEEQSDPTEAPKLNKGSDDDKPNNETMDTNV
jgi:hypothetical protein